jgi:hypothetical protein
MTYTGEIFMKKPTSTQQAIINEVVVYVNQRAPKSVEGMPYGVRFTFETALSRLKEDNPIAESDVAGLTMMHPNKVKWLQSFNEPKNAKSYPELEQVALDCIKHVMWALLPNKNDRLSAAVYAETYLV